MIPQIVNSEYQLKKCHNLKVGFKKLATESPDKSSLEWLNILKIENKLNSLSQNKCRYLGVTDHRDLIILYSNYKIW